MTKVFISWSGTTSHAVASTLYEWLPVILQNIKPFISSEDLRKGGRWNKDLAEELQQTNFGIICLTPSNLEAPWILFESGALSKFVEESRIAPLLIEVKPSQLPPPLTQFNATLAEREDFRKLVKSINETCGDSRVADELIEKSFVACWPQIDEKLRDARRFLKQELDDTNINRDKTDDNSINNVEKILQELILLSRNQLNILNSPDQLLPPGYLRAAVSHLSRDSLPPMVVNDLARSFEALNVAAVQLDGSNVEHVALENAIEHIRKPIEYILRRHPLRTKFVPGSSGNVKQMTLAELGTDLPIRDTSDE